MPLLTHDRREIAHILLPFFPEMAGATSEEWYGFLEALTAAGVSPEEPNATAFDRWRQALARLGYPVWHYTDADLAAIRERGRELAADAARRRQAQVAEIAHERRQRFTRKGE